MGWVDEVGKVDGGGWPGRWVRVRLGWQIGDGGTWFRNRLPEGRILKRERGTRDKMIINSTQKVSSRVLKSRNMMSIARTSLLMRLPIFSFQSHLSTCLGCY